VQLGETLTATLDVEGGILMATPRSGSLHDYPTLSLLLEPLLTYFSILTAYAASSGDMLVTLTIANGCNAYTSHLFALSQQFQWSIILQYYKSYFLSRCCKMAREDYSGWLLQLFALLYFYFHLSTFAYVISLTSGHESSYL
jgi:hypothetical protein